MLRAAIKHGICNALSARAGFEVWDFEIKEEQPSPDRETIEIRYRYQPGLYFSAAITAKSVDGNVPTYEIVADAVPGEVGEKETLTLGSRRELCAAIEGWTTRIEEELNARPSNRVLAAQEKAISYLEKHLLDIPDQRLTREQIVEYRRRLERLEAAIVELRAAKKDNGGRADAVRQEFLSLRGRLEVLGERSFLHAVLVRLVKYFWDDENLRIIEAGSRAAQDFLKDQDPPLSTAAKVEPPAATRTPAKPEAVPAANRTAAKPPAAPAATRMPPRPEVEPRMPAKAPAKPVVARVPGKAEPPPRTQAKPEPAAPAPAPKPAAAPAPATPAPERVRAAYKPLRPGRG